MHAVDLRHDPTVRALDGATIERFPQGGRGHAADGGRRPDGETTRVRGVRCSATHGFPFRLRSALAQRLTCWPRGGVVALVDRDRAPKRVALLAWPCDAGLTSPL